MRTRERYGAWALVAGASEGLGAAFAARLAAQGHDVLLVARRAEPLEALAAELRARHSVQVATLALDLATPDLVDRVTEGVAGREIGVLVCNAAHAPLGGFFDSSAADAVRALDVNCRAPLLLLHALVPAMLARGRGAVVIVSSLTAFQGTPWTTVYGSTKAFGLSLGEGLWAELRPRGVDVVVSCPGATRTPNYLRHAAKGGAPGELDPGPVAAETLDGLGRTPLVIPGRFNRFASFFLRRVLPRVQAIRVLGDQTRRLQ